MKIRITRPAENDLKALFDFIYPDSPRAAFAVSEAVVHAIQTLSAFPHRGREGRIASTRELVVSATGHVIAYRVAADEVTVLRIRHGRQAWPKA